MLPPWLRLPDDWVLMGLAGLLLPALGYAFYMLHSTTAREHQQRERMIELLDAIDRKLSDI